METQDISHKSDPLLHDTELPFHAVFHPLGFPLRLATNSQDVLECAAESWGAWAAEFDRPPVELEVLVEESGELALEAEFRARGLKAEIQVRTHPQHAWCDVSHRFRL